jgi:hypothetical protein
MSLALTLSSLSKEERIALLKKFTVRPEKTQYDPHPPSYQCFDVDIDLDLLYVPLGIVTNNPVKYKNNIKNVKKNVKVMSKFCVFSKELLTPETDPTGRGRNQVEVVDIALERLKKFYTVFLACYTGIGKTAMIIYLTIFLKLKTVVLCHLDGVRKQWVKAYEKFSGSTVKTQFVTGTGKLSKLDPTADVYIIGVKKASMMNMDVFKGIGTVVVDEVHIASVSIFTQVLTKIQPLYLIGSDATPDKCVAGYKFLNLYFGNPKDFIVRLESKNFIVYKVQTNFKPHVEYVMRRGKSTVDWNEIINSIEKNEAVWELVANIVTENPKDKIIVECNRNCFAKGIYNILVDRGDNVDLYIDKDKDWDASCRVLITGFKKGGVGLDDPDLTMAIIASDTTDVRQFEGRVRCTDNTIYHIVHDYKSLETHWNECEEWYKSKGGEIRIIGDRITKTKNNIKNNTNIDNCDPPVKRFLKPNL